MQLEAAFLEQHGGSLEWSGITGEDAHRIERAMHAAPSFYGIYTPPEHFDKADQNRVFICLGLGQGMKRSLPHLDRADPAYRKHIGRQLRLHPECRLEEIQGRWKKPPPQEPDLLCTLYADAPSCGLEAYGIPLPFWTESILAGSGFHWRPPALFFGYSEQQEARQDDHRAAEVDIPRGQD